jgi:hypothetical protein
LRAFVNPHAESEEIKLRVVEYEKKLIVIPRMCLTN